MAINIRCLNCQTDCKTGLKKCKKCGKSLNGLNKKYRVIVKMSNGKRISRTVDTLEVAKRVEAKFKTQAVDQKIFGQFDSPVIDEVWGKYIGWAKLNKRSWKDDNSRWNLHVKQSLLGLKMDKITPHHIQKILNDLSYVRHQLVPLTNPPQLNRCLY